MDIVKCTLHYHIQDFQMVQVSKPHPLTTPTIICLLIGSFRGINISPSTGGMESLTPNLPFSVDFTKTGKLLNMLATL